MCVFGCVWVFAIEVTWIATDRDGDVMLALFLSCGNVLRRINPQVVGSLRPVICLVEWRECHGM